MEGAQQRYETYALGCFASLKKGETAEVAYAQADRNDWTVSSKSTFSGIRIGPIGVPGFLGDLSKTISVGQGWTKLSSFVGLDRSAQDWVFWAFNNDGNGGTSFDGTDFTAPVDGIYAVEAGIRFDNAAGADNDYVRLVAAVNDNPDEAMNGHGIAEIRSAVPSTYFSMTLSGFLKMKKGDTAAIWTFVKKSGTVQHSSDSSGWSMALIHAL